LCVTSSSTRFGIDKAHGDELDGAIVGFVASMTIILGPRSHFAFASWFRCRTSQTIELPFPTRHQVLF
jgi:hypothetical protein